MITQNGDTLRNTCRNQQAIDNNIDHHLREDVENIQPGFGLDVISLLNLRTVSVMFSTEYMFVCLRQKKVPDFCMNLP